MTAVEALEGQIAKEKGQFVELSAQNIVDCSDEYSNHGCRSGLPFRAFQYVRDHGIETEEAYPFQEKENKECLFNISKSFTRIHGFKRIKPISEKKLAALVATVGPISVLVQASEKSWSFYKSGVLDDATCNSIKVNHAVLLVGYVDKEPKPYWIAKNSYGAVMIFKVISSTLTQQ
ncbi:cathepsin L-like [Mustelus asterias]